MKKGKMSALISQCDGHGWLLL